MSLLSGKCGVIVGVATKRSLAWAIAQGAAAQGARLLLTYQGERLGGNVRELAATLPETKILADSMQLWYDQLIASIRSGDFDTFNEVGFNPANWPANAKNSIGASGVGVGEAPRGSVAHWVTIKNSVIDNYQVVSPTTWNGSPRDAAGNPGAFEAALPGHTLARADQPLEILRTIHSFDPCLACAVHLVDPDGEDLIEVKVS